MFIPNPDNNNLFVFDNVANFGDAVERFARGANVFWRSGTTYDMLTRYENGKLVGAKYTVDENGASETPGGGGGGGAAGLVVGVVQDGGNFRLDKTYAEILSVIAAGGGVVLESGDGAENVGYSPVVFVGTQNGRYDVVFRDAIGNALTFTTEAETGYPSYGGVA